MLLVDLSLTGLGGWLLSTKGAVTAAHCGVTQLPRPQQETFARVSTTSEVSAASVAMRLHTALVAAR